MEPCKNCGVSMHIAVRKVLVPNEPEMFFVCCTECPDEHGCEYSIADAVQSWNETQQAVRIH